MEKHKTHLIYIDETGHAWLGEHGIGSNHPENAKLFCEIPKNDSPKWIEGIPTEKDIQFLTLSPFYPSQRLDVEIEVQRSTDYYVNHPAFHGCQKYIPLTNLDFRPIPKHIPRTLYTIGLCHYQHKSPYKTVEVPADNKMDAMQLGRKKLNPSIVEHVMYISECSNPAYDEYYGLKLKKIKKVKP